MNYSTAQIKELYTTPLLTLITQARTVHQQHFSDEIEQCQLISVKTGGCTEDCKYCSQSIHNDSKIKLNALLPIAELQETIINAKKRGVKRICLGAAYRSPTSRALTTVKEYIKLIKDHGLETCVTLGNLDSTQAQELKQSGLDYYNHNIDTSPEYYPQIVSTHTFNDRVETIANVAAAGINVCCGGIMGMGESQDDRISFIKALTDLPATPASIPINTLVKIAGTKLADVAELDKLELLRVIATLRIIFPATRIRLAAGRSQLTELEQTVLFLAGANSIFIGEKLLTTPNNLFESDSKLLRELTQPGSNQVNNA